MLQVYTYIYRLEFFIRHGGGVNGYVFTIVET